MFTTRYSLGVFTTRQSVGVFTTRESVGVFATRHSNGVFTTRESVGVFTTRQSVGVWWRREETDGRGQRGASFQSQRLPAGCTRVSRSSVRTALKSCSCNADCSLKRNITSRPVVISFLLCNQTNSDRL